MCEGAGVEVADDLRWRFQTGWFYIYTLGFEGVIFCGAELAYKRGAGQHAIGGFRG